MRVLRNSFSLLPELIYIVVIPVIILDSYFYFICENAVFCVDIVIASIKNEELKYHHRLIDIKMISSKY
ncbi:MAG TPA: hypothetical protein VFY77_00860 [Nitrososphaeraceae archaeon]|nr:hypothetical protein [Nitrososphaeraceae archaeon]